MGVFDPDAWLAKKEQQPSATPTPFDPDAWLAKKEQQPSATPTPFDPDAWLAKREPEVKEPNTGNFTRGLGNVPGQIQETYGGAKTLAGLLINSKDLVKSGLESMEEGKQSQISKESDSFSNAWEQGIGTVITDWLPYQIGSGIGNIAETLAFMGVGAVVGAGAGAGVGSIPGALTGVVGKSLLKKGVKEAAEKVLAESGEAAAKKFIETEAKRVITSASKAAAMATQAGMHGAGEVTGRAVEEAEKQGKSAEDIDLSRVIPAAIVHSVADFFVNKIGLDALKIGEKGMNNLALDIGKRIVVTGTKEVPAEMIQQVAERYGAKLSLTDAEALREYVDTIAASYGMSVAPGAVGGARTNFANKAIKNAKEYQEKGDLKQESTSAAGDVQKEAPPLNPDLVTGLSVATDEKGKPLATTSADTLKATQDLKENEAFQAQEQQKKIDAVQAYIDKVDAGGKRNRDEITALAKSLGVSFPQAIKSNVAKLELLRKHIAQQGAPSVEPTGTDESTTGASTGMAGQPPTPDATADGAKPSGVVSPTANATTTATGKGTQSSALNLTRGAVTPAVVSKLSDEQLNTELSNIDLSDAEHALIKTELQNRKSTAAAPVVTPLPVAVEGEPAMPVQGGQPVPMSILTTPEALERVKTVLNTNRPIEDLQMVARRGGLAEWEIRTILGERGMPVSPGSVKNETQAQNKTQVAPATLVTPKSISDLSPEMQEYVNNSQAEIANIEATGGDASKKKKFLNLFLAKQGITGTLSAKKSIEQDFLEQGEVPYAIPGEEKTEQQQEQERVATYEESLKDKKGEPRTIPKYEISEEDQSLYNETRNEVNSQVDAANEQRAKLSKQLDEAISEYDALVEAIDTEKEGDSQSAELNSKLEAAVEKARDAEQALKEHGPEQHMLPEYEKKFAADYKDVYFGNISAPIERGGRMVSGSSKREHLAAAKALQEYMRKTGGRNKEKMSAEDRRIVNHYEENRAEYAKLFGVQFPRWQDLTAEQKEIFRQEMKTNAGVQQDVAFAKLGVKLVQDSRELSEGEKREKQNTIDRKAEVRAESEKTQADLKKLREDQRRNSSRNTSLPSNVIKMVMDNNLQGVLQYMRSVSTTSIMTSPYRRIMKSVAQALFEMKLSTKIKIVDSKVIEGDLARYDPETDTILVTVEGLSSNTLLHEIIHAGTVKVINEYLYGNRKLLTAEQLKGVQQLERIMKETRDSLAVDHPNAYKNLFEFVAYVLTSDQLQQDLHDEQEISRLDRIVKKAPPKVPYAWTDTENIGTNLPEKKSQWSAFKLAIARILKVHDVYLRKGGNLNKDTEANFVMEVAAAFEDMLAKPDGPIELPALPSKNPNKKPTDDDDKMHRVKLGEDNSLYHLTQKEVPKNLWQHTTELRTVSGWRKVANEFQDNRYYVKAWERARQMAGQLKTEGKNLMNNIYQQIVLATGDGSNFYTVYISEPAEKLDKAVAAFAKSAGYTAKRAVEELHKIVEVIHEPERRLVKYILSVPLNDSVKNIIHNGIKITAAQRRDDIIKLLNRYFMSEAQAKQLREELNNIVFEKDANGNFILVTQDKDGNFIPDPNGYPKPNLKYVDPLGAGPRTATEDGARVPRNINVDADMYNATGVNLQDAIAAREQLKTHPQKAEIEKIIASLQELHKQTAALNKLANYWSQPVSNRVAFYGFENYVPLKGNPKHRQVDEDIDFDSKKNGRDMQSYEGSMDGRFSVSENPILKTVSDATRAALRAGRRNLTQSIKNSLAYDKEKNPYGQGILEGHVKANIKFEDRNNEDVKQYIGETTIFHYNEDGSIDILVVTNENLRNSIRRTFKNSNWMVDYSNKFTSILGQMHTRYNYQFAPMNFVRDVLTNAWNIGASELGPAEAARYIKDIAFLVVSGGMYKSMQVAVLMKKGDEQSLKALNNMITKDPFVRDMVEYIRVGGMVSHLSGMSLKSSFEDLNQSVGRSGIITSVADLNKLVDVWNNMFELTSRAAAYSVAKNNYQAKGMNANEAKINAAVFTKNLANFEQIGEWGRGMGAFYMFFRPSATGAVRAIEAAAPAFPGSLKRAEDNLPPDIADNEEAKAKYLENYKVLQRNSRIMVGSLFSLGMIGYMMAQMMSDDDDLGRNAVATDNMEQWTRFLRFHVPRGVSKLMGINEPLIFQVPWGFGLGAFAAAGAQIAAAGAGAQDWSKAFANIFTSIALDSFVPIPVSRMSAPDNPVAYLIDSIAPSFVRPLIEFAMNKNGLGQDINSTSQRRMGDAYTGGDAVPEMWKDAARWLHDTTNGDWDISPNTLYFLSNNYVDGVSRIAENVHGIHDLSQARKEFSPRTDVPLLGSFFGVRSNYDARQFGQVEKKIQHMERIINDFKDNPEKMFEYREKYPMAEMLVDIYNKQLNRELNPLRAEDKRIRLDKRFAPVDRKAMLEINAFKENMIKSQMVDMFKAYGVEP